MEATKTFTNLSAAEFKRIRRATKRQGGIARGFSLEGSLTLYFPSTGYLTPANRLENTLLELGAVL